MVDFRIRVVIDPRQATQGTKKVEQQLARVERRASRLRGLLQGAFAPLIGIAGAALAIRTLANFEQEIAAVGAISQASAKELAEFRDVAIDLGTNTRFSATQAAEGLTFLARAGFTAAESLEAIEGTLKLAQAGQLDLGRAADIASNVLKGFRLEVDQTARVVDVLALSANSSNTSVNQLGEALSFAAPIASGLGVSIEETTAAISALSNAGLQGSRAGTGLNRVLANLEAPTDKAKEILRSLGVEASEVQVTTVGLTAAIDRLAEAGVSTGQALEIFGQRGGPAFEVLSSSVSDVERFTVQFGLAGGTADELAEKLDDNLKGSLLALRSAFQGLILELGESGATGALRGLVDAATSGFRLLADNADTVRNVLLGVSVVVGVNLVNSFAAATASAFTANAALNLTALSSTRLGIALRALPLVAVATGLVAATAAALDLVEEFDKIDDLFEEARVKGDEFARTDFSIALSKLTRAQEQLAITQKTLNDDQAAGREASAAITAQFERQQERVAQLTKVVDAFREAGAETTEQLAEYRESVDNLSLSVSNFVTGLEEENEQLLKNAREREIQLSLLKQIRTIEEESGVALTEAQRLELEAAIRKNTALNEQAALLDDIRGSNSEFAAQAAALGSLRSKGLITEQEYVETFARLKEEILGVTEAQDTLVATTESAASAGTLANFTFQQLGRGLASVVESGQAYLAQQQSIARGTFAAIGPQERFAQIQRDLNAALEAGTITQEQYVVATNNLSAATRQAGTDIGSGLQAGLGRIQNQILDTSGLVEDALVGAFNSAEDALVDFLTTGEADFSSFVDSVLEDITRLLVRQALISGLGFAGIPGFADGGQVPANRPILVGEEGPELFIPPSAGRIASNPETKDLLSQGGGGGAAAVSIVNVLDPELVTSALSGSAGEQIILNVIRNNASTVRQSIS